MSVDVAVLLVTHGTVDDLADLPAFVTNIRRGVAPPPELIAELLHRYKAIGGRSPLNDQTRVVANKLEATLGVPVRMASRLWKPLIKEVLASLGAKKVVVLPLAQHSASIYVRATEAAAKEIAVPPVVVGVSNWGQTPELLDAFAKRIRATALTLEESVRADSTLVLSAHSLPLQIVQSGDPYEEQVRASAASLASRVADVLPDHLVAFQSQGVQSSGKWLGPDLRETLDAIAKSGKKTALFAPIGFLADHVEILYDLDIEAAAWAKERGLSVVRAPSLNADDDFVDVLASLARPLLS